MVRARQTSRRPARPPARLVLRPTTGVAPSLRLSLSTCRRQRHRRLALRASSPRPRQSEPMARLRWHRARHRDARGRVWHDWELCRARDTGVMDMFARDFTMVDSVGEGDDEVYIFRRTRTNPVVG